MAPKERPAAMVRGEPDAHASGQTLTPIKPIQGAGQPAKVASSDITVAVIEKDARAQVRVTINTWRGTTKVNIRQFDPGAVAGTWWPSGKGAALDIEKLPQLVEAIRKAEAEARRLGLLSARGAP
jgi:hypothetical protein